MKNQYNDSYYQDRYTETLTSKIGLNKIYYIWIAFYCLIRTVRLKRKAKVLDFGCGVGSYVWALKKLGMEAYGIDSSTAAK
jgi:2-polyprenyl-3-methyl-5-hydroxy-6-metoxy-1,4-benzoquinol methylase